MTDYGELRRDYILRTRELIQQYDDFTSKTVTSHESYEVTLLLNCLSGLLVYPQQLAHRDKWQGWYTNKLVSCLGPKWVDDTGFVKNAGYTSDGKTIDRNNLTTRQLIRQLRNSFAHADFEVIPDDQTNQIAAIRFMDNEREDDGFLLEIPVEELKEFLLRITESALTQIGKRA